MFYTDRTAYNDWEDKPELIPKNPMYYEVSVNPTVLFVHYSEVKFRFLF